MANSRITITFGTDVTVVGFYTTFRIARYDDPATILDKKETWVYGVAQQFEAQIYPTPTGGNQSARNYEFAIQRDYSGENIYNISVIGNQVTIEFKTDEWFFEPLDTNVPNCTAVIENITPSTFELTADQIMASVIPCQYVKARLTLSETPAGYFLNDVWTANTSNPLDIELLRNVNNYIIVENAAGDKVYYLPLVNQAQPPIYYGSLVADNMNVQIDTYQTGATLTITVAQADNLTLEYSLDSLVWQSSNIFTGQQEGAGTAYVRDEFGCQTAKAYNVDALGTVEPNHFISKAIGVQFVLITDEFDGRLTLKNDENTFAYENLAELPSCTTQLIQTDDTTTIQLKTNYPNVEAVLRHANGSKDPIPMVKMSENINRFESLDSFMYNYGNNQTGIFFTTGNVYDKVGSIIGTFALNGNLPDFAEIGNYVEIEGVGTFQIQNTPYDESVKKRVIVVNNPYSGGTVAAISKSTYNLLPYEIWQGDVNWSLFAEGMYDIQVTLSELENQPDVNYLSENIELANVHEGTVKIDYYNDNNRDIFYRYGVENRIRVPFISIQATPNQESQMSLTDDGAYVVDSSTYEADTIIFEYMVKSMMRKVSIALASKFVFLNDIGYVGDGDIEFEPIGQTNLYSVQKNMVKSNVNYTTRNVGNSGVGGTYISFLVPPVTSFGTGLIKR